MKTVSERLARAYKEREEILSWIPGGYAGAYYEVDAMLLSMVEKRIKKLLAMVDAK